MMGLENYGNDELIEALANRGIDARNIEEFSMTELNNEITRRDNEREIEIQARHDAEMAQEDQE